MLKSIKLFKKYNAIIDEIISINKSLPVENSGWNDMYLPWYDVFIIDERFVNIAEESLDFMKKLEQFHLQNQKN